VSQEHTQPTLPPIDPARARQLDPDAVTPEALAALLVDGDVDLAAWALRISLSGRPRTEVYETLVFDAMRLVGQNWSDGRWTISEEHLACQTLTEALAAVAPVATPTDRIGPLAVISCVEGGEHTLGLIAVEHILREAGWSVANLRQSVPTDDLVAYVARMEARLVALSASREHELPAIREVIAAVHALPDPPAVMVGGRLASLTDATAMGADWAGTSLRAAREFVLDLRHSLPGPGGSDASEAGEAV
jgi:methanogenic corrinoid protein MtbC1